MNSICSKYILKRKRLLVVLLLFLKVNLFAQEKLSLQQAIETGLKNNYSILISKNDLEISKNIVSIGNAGALPQLNLSFSQTNSVNDIKQKYSRTHLLVLLAFVLIKIA